MPSTRSFAVSLLLTASAIAQDHVVQVIPGRDFVHRKLLTPGLIDTVKLVAERDEMLWCIVESHAFDPVLTFVDAAGNVLATNDGEGTRSELWVRAPAKGAYAFRVSPFQGSGGGHYELSLHRFCTEPLAAAGGEATHTFGKEQWWHYRVALKQGDVLVPTVLGDGRLTAVLDEGRNVLPGLHGGHRAPRDGDVFVRVEGPEVGRCQVLTQLARAGERELDRRHDERIAPYGLDTWSVQVPAGACIAFDLRTPETMIGLDIPAVDPDGRGPAFVPMGHFDKGGCRRLLYFVRRDATLLAHLRNDGSAAAPYELAVRRWGDEAAVGATIAGRMQLGDGALFHLALPAGEMVELAVDSDQFDAALDVLDPDGNLIAQVDDRALTDRNPLHRFLVTRPGTYHALIHCRGGVASGAFTFRSRSEPLPSIEPGRTIAVTANVRAHVHLELQADEVVWLSLRSGTFDGALQVVDPTGDGRFVAEGGGIGGDVLVAYRCSHAGRHTLIVHARSGSGDGELKVVRP